MHSCGKRKLCQIVNSACCNYCRRMPHYWLIVQRVVYCDLLDSSGSVLLKNPPHLVGVWFILLTQLEDFNIGVWGPTLCNKIQIVKNKAL